MEVECLLLLMMYCRDLVSGSLWMYVYWEDVKVVCVLGGCEGGVCIGSVRVVCVLGECEGGVCIGRM